MAVGVVADRVKESTTTTGTGDLACGGAQTGYRAISSVMSDGDMAPFVCALGAEWEVFIGRYNSGANTVTRLEVKASSNSGALVAFSAGTKDLYISGIAAQLPAVAAFPFTPATGLLGRWNASYSQSDLDNRGNAKKVYDISGNARHSTVNTTNSPKWVTRSGVLGLPAWYFDGGQRIVIPSFPSIASPFAATVCWVGWAWGVSGNSHIYNWNGNPIGFGATTPCDLMYNGTLPAVHPDSQSIVQDHRHDGITAYPVIGIHSYNGASSVASLNNSEQGPINPGIIASGGGTVGFTIGGDATTGSGGQFCKMALWDLAVLNFPANSTQRQQLLAYYKAVTGIKTQ